MTKRHVKVALSGDGGDEVFGGYPKYLLGVKRRPVSWRPLMDRSLRAVRWRPRGMGRLYWRFLSSDDHVRYTYARYGDFPIFRKDLRQLLTHSYHPAAAIDAYFEPWEMRAQRYGQDFGIEVLMKTDLETYLSENCLVKTDRASMLASLEVRVPYLDELVLDRILPLPAKAKIVDGRLKALLQPLARRLLPREVWDRPKHGFTVPYESNLSKDWRPALETAFDWGRSNFRLFDYEYLDRLHAINLSNRNVGRELWNPFVLLAWCMEHSLTV
jgi:asparagine synthase (glutamine-hydrolysing)